MSRGGAEPCGRYKIRQLTDVLHCKLQHHFHVREERRRGRLRAPGTAAERSALSPASLEHRAKEPDEYDDADPADPTARTAVPRDSLAWSSVARSSVARPSVALRPAGLGTGGGARGQAPGPGGPPRLGGPR